MPANAVIFEGFGDDLRLRELPNLTNTRPYGRFQQLETPDSNRKYYYVAVQIVDTEMEESDALNAGLNWLVRHAVAIRDLTTRRNLEVQTSFLPEDGSRALCIPPEASEILSDFACRLIHQCSRRVTLQELRERGIDIDRKIDN
jgi:hypothetical protein